MQNTEKETLVFKTGHFSTWLMYLLALAVLAVYLLLIGLMPQPKAILLWSIIFLVVGGFFVCLILRLRRGRLEITPSELRIAGAFQVRSIPFAQIKGFKLHQTQRDNAVYLILDHGRKRRIPLGFKDAPYFLATLDKRLPNLDREAREADLRELFQQLCFGDATPEEKAATVRRLRKVCRAINYAAIAVALWAFFYPHPYEGLIWTLVAFPLPALFLLRQYEGVIRFYPRQGSVFPRVEAAFILPAMALALRAAMDWHTLDWHPFLPPFVTLFLLGSLLGLATARELRRSALCTALFGLTFLFYAFGAVDTLNGMLATSPATAYRVQVQSKRTQHEKITVYYLTVTPWGHRTEPTNEVIVSEEVYQRAQPGGTVEIQVRTGKFGIPFYQVR